MPRVTGVTICNWTQIKYEIPGRQLDFVGTIDVLDHQFAAVIFVRFERNSVTDNRSGCASRSDDRPHRVIDVNTEWCPSAAA